METMEGKQPRARRSFTAEFDAEIIQLCQRGDRSIGQVARDLDLTETAVREWYPFIEAEKTQQRNVKRACELLEVSRAAYYATRRL